jgi:phage shock protein A
MLLHEKLAKHGHMAMAKDAMDLHDSLSQFRVAYADQCEHVSELKREIDALQDEIMRLKDIRLKVAQIENSTKAIMEVIGA